MDGKDAAACCDRELFAQVWSRVAPGEDSPVEPVAPTEGPAVELAGEEECLFLQELILDCLTDAAALRALVRRETPRRGGRCREELTGLAGQKGAQARTLAAAYFLRSGVRYWPAEVTPPQPPEGFFPILRRQFFAQEELAARLADRAAHVREDRLGQLYAHLSAQCREMAQTLWQLVEREM